MAVNEFLSIHSFEGIILMWYSADTLYVVLQYSKLASVHIIESVRQVMSHDACISHVACVAIGKSESPGATLIIGNGAI